MDANNTRFHLLLGQADWMRCDSDPDKAVTWSLAERLADREVLQQRSGEAPDGAAWDPDRQELTLKKRMFQFVAAPRDTLPTQEDRRGAACDRFGSWYWVAHSQREIQVRSSGSQTVTRFWHAEDGVRQPAPVRRGDFQAKDPGARPRPQRLCGLAVTDDHYLVVGTAQPAGLLIFDLFGGGAPQHALWPEGVDFAPFDMAPMPGGGVWILDRQHQRYWAVARGFGVITAGQESVELRPEGVDAFQPKEGAAASGRRRPGRTFPRGISGEPAASLGDLDCIAIEALPDGTVLLLDSGAGSSFSSVHRYRFDRRLGLPVSFDILDTQFQKDFQGDQGGIARLVAHDFAFVAGSPQTSAPDNGAGALFVAADGGNQSIRFALSLDGDQLKLDPQPEFFPMRLYGGRGLAVAAGKVCYDFGDDSAARWLPLTLQNRPRYATSAVLYTPVFDGREPDCVWHRLMLDARIPAGCTVTICSRSGNDKPTLKNDDWREEPLPRLRPEGSELPYSGEGAADVAAGRGTWELLFQQAHGRYLQLRVTLGGNGRSTPRLRALRAYYPRFSYLEHYLPAVYREDRTSALFLERFLANFEGIFTSIEDRIAAAQLLLDLRSAPADALEWLAGWFDVALDPAWDDARRRLFIAHAMDFFRYRGTASGLKMALRLALEECADDSLFELEFLGRRAQARNIRIAERFSMRRTSGSAAAPDKLAAMRDQAHRFTVQLPVASATVLNSEQLRQRVELARRLVELEKPAHTTFDIQLYWAMFRVGEVRLGEDTLLSLGSRSPDLMPPLVLGEGYLAESMLQAGYPQNVADRPVVLGASRVQ